MRSNRFNLIALIFILSLLIGFWVLQAEVWASDEIETPEKHFGFKPGTDGMLFDYEELIKYLQKLDNASPRLKLVEIGKSPLGKKMYIAFISSEENLQNLEVLKEINRKLALEPNIPQSERKSMFEKGKVFVLATLSMHSGEVGPSQAAPLSAYDLVTTDNTQILEKLDDVVFMMVPCHNPDGMDMVVSHYKKCKGTKYDGSSMPGVYHKYVGHDNNRDFITLTQEDNQAVARIYNRDWFPQVMVEKHQMGSTGPRYFVPPVHDPIAENVDESLWNWTWIFGSNMAKDMTKEGLAGVSQHYIFDDYWPGSTETCIWKNVIGLLTECASVKYATPIFIEPNELTVHGKGLAEYKKSINMPLPWPGGWWKLSDIVSYEIVSTMSLIKTAALHRKDILKFRNDLCQKQVEMGKTKPPYYYVLPLEQHDQSELVKLVNLLNEHGVAVYRLSAPTTLGAKSFKQGDIVVPLAQPFRPFIKEVMERQEFPARHYTPGGELIKPYDITSWSLPLHRGVKSIEVEIRSESFESLLKKIEGDFSLEMEMPEDFWTAVFTVNNNESFKAAFLALQLGLKVHRLDEAAIIDGAKACEGSFVIFNGAKMKQLIDEMSVSPVIIKEPLEMNTTPLKMPRIALVETFFHDMDAGWTRFVFDTYYIPYKVVHPGDFAKTDFAKDFDVVVFPDADKSILMSGKWKSQDTYYISSYPPEYTKGIGKEGMAQLMTFLDSGGIIISWGRSTNLFLGILEIKRGKDEKEEFQLPVRDNSKQLQKDGLYCPGSLVKMFLLQDHPIALGMQKEIGVFFRGRPVFSTSFPNFDMDRRVIGRFPEKNILLSGYCEKEVKMGNQTGLVWLKKGRGQLVLFAFNPQFRASTNVSFKLMFNSILLTRIEEALTEIENPTDF